MPFLVVAALARIWTGERVSKCNQQRSVSGIILEVNIFGSAKDGKSVSLLVDTNMAQRSHTRKWLAKNRCKYELLEKYIVLSSGLLNRRAENKTLENVISCVYFLSYSPPGGVPHTPKTNRAFYMGSGRTH